MAEPWTIKNGIYELIENTSKNKKKFKKAIQNIVQSNLNAGRTYNHGIEGIKIDGKDFRIGGLGKDKTQIIGTDITLKPSKAGSGPDARTIRTTMPDSQFESRVFFKQLEDINDLNNRLKLPEGDPNKITSKVWESKLKSLVRKNRLQLPGIRPGEWNLGAWNKSLYGLASKLPDEFFSKANYEKFMRKNYAVAQKVAAEMKRLTGIDFDAGHPQAGGANIGLTAQLRYHVSRGNQTIKNILPQFKDIVKSATDDVWGPNQLKTAGIPFDHIDGMYNYLNQYLPPDKTFDWDSIPEAKRESILFNKEYAPNPEAARFKADLELLEETLRMKETVASQPPRASVFPVDTELPGNIVSVQRGKKGLGNIYQKPGGIKLKSVKNLVLGSTKRGLLGRALVGQTILGIGQDLHAATLDAYEAIKDPTPTKLAHAFGSTVEFFDQTPWQIGPTINRGIRYTTSGGRKEFDTWTMTQGQSRMSMIGEIPGTENYEKFTKVGLKSSKEKLDEFVEDEDYIKDSFNREESLFSTNLYENTLGIKF